MSVRLIKYDAARLALAEAHRVDEAKEIRDKAVELAAYARQAQDRDMVTWVTEIKGRAERRVGELLRETANGRQRKTGGKLSSRNDGLPTLKKLQISPDPSSDWQKLAAIPEPEFERRLEAAKADPTTMTSCACRSTNLRGGRLMPTIALAFRLVRRIATALAGLVMIAGTTGCAAAYVKAGATNEQVASDKLFCKLLANAGGPSAGNAPFMALAPGDGFSSGLAQGAAVGSVIRANREREQLYQLCMEAKGYVRE